MRNATNRHIVRMEGGAYLHTRKGWRGDGMARPSGTNRRRKLTPAAYRLAPLSRVNRLWQTARVAGKSIWGKLKVEYGVWLNDQRENRLKHEARLAADAAAAVEAAKVAKASA